MNPWILRADAVDRRLLVALARRRVPRLGRIMRVWTRIGDPTSAVAVSGVLLALDLLAGVGGGGHAAISLAAAHVASHLIKRSISRPRPRLPEGIPALLEPPDRFSFPSGHAAASLAIGLPVALAIPTPLGLVVVAAALLVGVSRCYLGVHYPGDVAAGWGIAVASVAAAGWLLP